jgi:hypothetical protein
MAAISSAVRGAVSSAKTPEEQERIKTRERRTDRKRFI